MIVMVGIKRDNKNVAISISIYLLHTTIYNLNQLPVIKLN